MCIRDSRRIASYRVGSRTDRDYGSRSRIVDGSSVARGRRVDERRARSTATGDSIHPSIHPYIHPSIRQRRARGVRSRARVRPRAVGAARVRPRAARDDKTARERTESTTRDRFDSIRARVVDRSRTNDRSTVDSIRFRDGRRDIDARDDLGEARRKRGRPSRTARADACADARSARARCRTRTCRAGGRWRCARGGRRSERCRARSRE